METKWEITKKGHTYYVDIQGERVIVGSFFKDGHTDNAGEVTFEEFLDGEYFDHIGKIFGKKVLVEIVSTVEKLI
ncbi:MAG TPA: hypothetical protein ENI23_14360 [bacterium]|nr:hypothetical protein [bacterium]